MTRIYPVRDHRSSIRFTSKRNSHTGGPCSGKTFGTTPAKTVDPSQLPPPKGLEIASPVIPVKRQPWKAGPGKTEGPEGQRDPGKL